MVSLLVAMALAASAKVPSAYEGQWVLDKAQSRGLPAYYDRVKRHALLNTAGENDLKVHVEVDIGAPQADVIDLDYPLDGTTTETSTPVRGPKGMMPVPTQLRGAVRADGGLHMEADRTIPMGGQNIQAKSSEDWKLTPDGKQIIVERTDTTPNGPMTSTMVFVRP